MKEPITTLLSNGTTTSIFLAVLLTAIVVFAGWIKKFVETQSKSKDEKIERLEKTVEKILHFQQNEMIDLITETNIISTKFLQAFDRLEYLLKKLNNI